MDNWGNHIYQNLPHPKNKQIKNEAKMGLIKNFIAKEKFYNLPVNNEILYN